MSCLHDFWWKRHCNSCPYSIRGKLPSPWLFQGFVFGFCSLNILCLCLGLGIFILCGVFSETPESMVSCLSVFLESSQPLLYEIFLFFLFLFFPILFQLYILNIYIFTTFEIAPVSGLCLLFLFLHSFSCLTFIWGSF